MQFLPQSKHFNCYTPLCLYLNKIPDFSLVYRFFSIVLLTLYAILKLVLFFNNLVINLVSLPTELNVIQFSFGYICIVFLLAGLFIMLMKFDG
jgi:hypothetical protein